ncbi:MAG TPA: AI-2E family transporter [Bacteriovoracaceae bacterium]|nr:AI-2E family transporter [Bacteriovoracaceae bacterium]
MQLEIPSRTYLKAFVMAGIAYLVIKLAPVILLLFISLLIGITLSSMERFLIRKGWKKSIADSTLILGLIGILGIFMFYVIPQALGQMEDLFHNLPRLKTDIIQLAPEVLQENVKNLFQASPDSLQRIWNQLGSFANETLNSLFEFAVMIVASIYMLLHGNHAYEWILAFFDEKIRIRIDKTAREIIPIVEAYIIGQATTSTLAAIWVFTAAMILDIPAPLTLAVLAAVFDILPGIGFILNVSTAGLLALTVSTQTAITMVICLMVYSALENYVLIPHIYGNRMKLSPLVVLLSLIVSGSIAGIPGMIAILPIVAAYGPIERNWLKNREGFQETVEIHQKNQELNHE